MTDTTTTTTKTCPTHGDCKHTEKSGCTKCVKNYGLTAKEKRAAKSHDNGFSYFTDCTACGNSTKHYVSTGACIPCTHVSNAAKQPPAKRNRTEYNRSRYEQRVAADKSRGISREDGDFYRQLPETAKLSQKMADMLVTITDDKAKMTIYETIADAVINDPIARTEYYKQQGGGGGGSEYGKELDAMVRRVKAGIEAGHWPYCTDVVARAKMRIVTLEDVLAHESKFIDGDGNYTYTFTYDILPSGMWKVTSFSDNFWPLYEALFEDVMAFFFTRVKDQQLRVLHEVSIMTELRAIVAKSRESNFANTVVQKSGSDTDRDRMIGNMFFWQFRSTFNSGTFKNGVKFLREAFANAKKHWAAYDY